MKLRHINFGKARAFSLVEMMVTIAIVGILISLLIPALGLVKKTASMVKQKSQFSTIEMGLEAFKMDFDGYPESEGNAADGYYGANKLAEAMVGQDSFGFHRDSQFQADGRDLTDNIPFYWGSIEFTGTGTDVIKAESLAKRKGPYLEIDTANVTRLGDIYNNYSDDAGGDTLTLADTFRKVTLVNPTTGKKSRTGMPVLYYRANTSNVGHSYAEYMSIGCTYSYFDNWPLIQLGVPFDASLQHPILSVGANPEDNFYNMTQNMDFTVTVRPYRPESFILHSAGFDGLYGTEDDVFNFDKGK